MLTLGWVAYSQLRDTAEQKTMSQMSTLLRQIDIHLDSYLSNAKANIELLAESDLISRYMIVEDAAERYELLQPSVLALLSSYQQDYPSYKEIRILLPDGYEDTRSTLQPLNNVTEEEGDAPYFRRMTQSPEMIHSEFFRNPDTGHHALLVGRRIMLEDPGVDPAISMPRVRGYLTITADLEFLRKQTQSNQIGQDGRLFFTDGKGYLLFADGRSGTRDKLPSDLFRELVRKSGEGEVLRDSLEGRMSVFHGMKLQKDLYVFAALPEEELLAASHRLRELVAGMTLATTLIAALLLFGLLKTLIIAPIQKLGAATQEISRGNLQVAVTVDRKDEIGDLALAFEDMSQSLLRSANQIQYLAYHDSLTGLPNRYMFTDYLERALSHAKRHRQVMALLFLDLDGFKRVNDTLGHEAGDQLLQELAARLDNCLRRDDFVIRADTVQDTVARLGGDEFIVLLTRIQSAHDSARVATRILASVSEPFFIGKCEFQVGASIGITTFPADGDEADTLIKNADVAMYHAKKSGKNNYRFYSDSMNQAAVQRFTMENALRNAIDSDQFTLYYQPLVDSESRTLKGFEALIRWHHPEMGFLPPDSFIPLAEETGLIIPLGEWVLREACQQAKAWEKSGYEPVRMSVNISNIQFNSPGFEETVKKVLEATDLPPHRLEIELTESSIMQAPDSGLETLIAIKALGVCIAMDDFGTGYSSLSALRRLPVDTLKIDRSFVDGVIDNRDDAVIVSMIIAMARILHLKVTAEGVETEEQLGFLHEQGCDTIQGYYISRPVPVEEAVDYLTPVSAATV